MLSKQAYTCKRQGDRNRAKFPNPTKFQKDRCFRKQLDFTLFTMSAKSLLGVSLSPSKKKKQKIIFGFF